MYKKKWQIGITDILLLIMNGVFLLGMHTFLSPCEQLPDGKWMVCHWAGEALIGIASALFVISLLHALIPRAPIKAGLTLAAIPMSVLALLFAAGHIIDLCMMETMRCHTVMKPAVMAISVLTILLDVVDIYKYGYKKEAG